MNRFDYLVCQFRNVTVRHHQRYDSQRRDVTWGEVLNPLRYAVRVGSLHINEGAIAWTWVSNTVLSLKAMCWLQGHDFATLDNFEQQIKMCSRCKKIMPGAE